MNVYFLGEYIKKQREKLGLTQEQVCEGICEQVTLSRLENGRQTPSRTRVNALLQRLGLPEDRYYMILTKNELEIEALKKEIIACNALDSAKEGFSKVEQLEKLVNTDDNLEKQFILRSKALLGYLAGRYTKEEKLRMLIQAIGVVCSKRLLNQAVWKSLRTHNLKPKKGAQVMRKNEKITALYERLSRDDFGKDDDQQRESNSISNQKAMLEEFAARQGFTNIVHFTDDGISGTCFVEVR